MSGMITPKPHILASDDSILETENTLCLCETTYAANSMIWPFKILR